MSNIQCWSAILWSVGPHYIWKVSFSFACIVIWTCSLWFSMFFSERFMNFMDWRYLTCPYVSVSVLRISPRVEKMSKMILLNFFSTYKSSGYKSHNLENNDIITVFVLHILSENHNFKYITEKVAWQMADS